MGPKHSYTRVMLFVFFILLHFSPPIFAARIPHGSQSPPPTPEEDDYAPLFKWPEKTLKYAFLQQNPVNYLSITDVELAISRAFTTWSSVIPVSFEQTGNLSLANATIGFFRGDHGDGNPFIYDSTRRDLAHTFPPPNGEIHFNTDVRWAVDFHREKSRDAYDLETVATHEIGHLLGLNHSRFEGAVMYPTVNSRTKKVHLSIDDVNMIQGVYGVDPDFDWSSLHSSGWSILKESRRFSGWLIILLAIIMIL